MDKNGIENARRISPQDLMALGLSDVAYVRPAEIDGQSLYAIHGADGTRLAVVPSREVALAIARRNDLEPVSVH